MNVDWRRRTIDVIRACGVLAAAWVLYLFAQMATDDGSIAAAFREAMHNPYGHETPGLLDEDFPPGTRLDAVQSKMRQNRFACDSSELAGPLLVICGRSGSGGRMPFALCERSWRGEFLFERSGRGEPFLKLKRAVARGEC